ncbi:MAG: YvrJ family protein [Selenomonadaceae bacterium]|nr:YvrJ family protein [Selenomonadaceae bacterium]
MTELLSMIGSYGFPMAVTAFLLVRIESRLAALNDSLQALTQAIAVHR